ncbi:SDR family oxidoreductase [Pseudomonas citronellolis]|uniref:SDR family oxidoreductase n=1 Tax=Pseudomonas citronellolis TaxID=53408 RepID=UPI0021C1BF10|nr:SDR family oxidoreductase [Pseudomonas citronellolis]UXJ49581.1 SDR family oxidoreductase [Pseudomonas citronellolis]
MNTDAKNVVITGASSGLGAGMARGFAARGYNLALCARRVDRLEDLRRELIARYDVRIELRALDVNNHADVFQVFREFQQLFGHIDRIVVNAGVGEGRRIGTGHFDINRRTAETNFIAALAQCEAAVEIFRQQNFGHLVTISSMSAVRGLPKHLTTYAASKAALAHLTEGIRAELLSTPIRVSTIFPGYIRTELNAGAKRLPFEVDEETGCRALVAAIERKPATAYVPTWPWAFLGAFIRFLPLRWIVKLN